MVFVEIPSFTKKVVKLLEDESYGELQVEIMERPEAGKLIRQSGGLRKIRWAASGRGKSGGVRVIYYWWVSEEQVLLLDIYPKNEKEDLSATELANLKKQMEEWQDEQSE
jgi:mRNA-degrading endonuclease RelE of RelBE toxin-antitoxin system